RGARLRADHRHDLHRAEPASRHAVPRAGPAHAMSHAASLHAWLTAEVTQSARQASLQRLYFSWLRLRSNPLAMIGCTILCLLVLIAIFAPLIAPYGFDDQSLELRLKAPSAAHWFGTDDLGRDIFSRIVLGSRITLMIACLVAVIAAPI